MTIEERIKEILKNNNCNLISINYSKNKVVYQNKNNVFKVEDIDYILLERKEEDKGDYL